MLLFPFLRLLLLLNPFLMHVGRDDANHDNKEKRPSSTNCHLYISSSIPSFPLGIGPSLPYNLPS